MNYEHNEEFERRPGSNQGNGSQREPGQPGSRPGRALAGNGQEEQGRRPVRREGARTQETFGQPEGRGAKAGSAPGAGRMPEDGRAAGRQAGRMPGTGRIPQEAGAAGRQTGRLPQEAGEAGRQAGRTPGTGRIPREAGEAGRRPERLTGTGRIPGEMRSGFGERQPEGRPGTGTGREPGAAGREGELSVMGAKRGPGTARQTAQGRAADGRNVSPGRASFRETASAREADARDGLEGAGRNRRAAGANGMGETPREALAQAKIQKAKKKRRTRRIIAMIVAECLMLTVIFTYAYFARRLNMIQREDFNKEDVKNSELSVDDLTKMKGYWMIAVFGVDSRSTSVGAGNQADVNMICCINQDTGEIKMVSVYRDTYLNINDGNSYRKINAAYANGGPEQALKALNKNLDLNITDYVTFSWKAVAEGINILGGVDVEITRSEFRFINAFITETVRATNIGSHQLPAPGLHHLDGVQAVAYGRLRLMDTDFARTERQRKIIELAFAKAKKADYATLNNILVTTLPSISTNLDFADMTNLALSISKYHIGETAGFPFAKGTANMPGKGDCVIPQTLESNVSQLHTFLFGDESYSPTEQVKQISSKIAADSGMHREGKPSKGSALATDSYVREETTAQRTTEADTTEETSETDESGESREPMTDEYGNMILYPDETDENGDLIDAPIDDWPEEDPLYPGGGSNNQTGIQPQGPGNPSGPGTQGPGTEPSESSGSHGSGSGTTPGSESQWGNNRPSGGGTGSQTPDENGGPGGNAGPGGSSQTGTTPSGNGSPGGTGNSGSEGNGDEAGGPGSAQRPSGGQTPSQPSQGGQTPGQSSQGGQTPSQPSQGGQTPGQSSQGGQTPGQSSQGGQTPGQSSQGGQTQSQSSQGGQTLNPQQPTGQPEEGPGAGQGPQGPGL